MFPLKIQMLLFLIILSSCNSESNSYSIIINDEFNNYLKEESIHIDFNQNLLIHYVDVGCGNCLNDLTNWEKFAKSNGMNGNQFLFIATSFNGIKDFEYMIENKILEFSLPIIYDKENLFYSENKNVMSQFDNSVIVNKGNVIIGGDPFSNRKLKEDYLSSF